MDKSRFYVNIGRDVFLGNYTTVSTKKQKKPIPKIAVLYKSDRVGLKQMDFGSRVADAISVYFSSEQGHSQQRPVYPEVVF